jgi:hypothetical protein
LAGVEIESYYDYVPYLRDGELIPSGRIMGDDQTQGSIIHETVANLRSASDNPITTIAWLSYFFMIREQTFHEGASLIEWSKTQANFLGQVNKIVEAAHWTAEAEAGMLENDTQVYEKDLDLDGELEYVMHNDRVFAIFENDGGRLEYAFAYDPEYGPIQVIAPNNQYNFFITDEVDYQNGEAAISLAWHWTPNGAFVEDIDQDGKFEYEPLTASIGGSNLTFTYETHPMSKTYTLKGDTIHVHYERDLANTLIIGFANAVNLLGIFDKDWIWNFEPIQMQEALGWQMTSGGSVLLNVKDTYNVETASFFDSPARQEMKQREDDSGYPEGHWMYFPFSWITILDTQEDDYSLTLSAAPVDKSTYTPLPTPTPTPTAAPPTPTLSPEQEISLFIYDDAAGPGWDIWTWEGEVDIAVESVVHSGQMALGVTLDARGGIGLFSPIDFSEFVYLEFYINGGSQGGQELEIYIWDAENDVEVEHNPLSVYTSSPQLLSDEWLLVRYPLQHLDLSGRQVSINITNTSDQPAPQFFLDDIRLVKEAD